MDTLERTDQIIFLTVTTIGINPNFGTTETETKVIAFSKISMALGMGHQALQQLDPDIAEDALVAHKHNTTKTISFKTMAIAEEGRQIVYL